MSELEKLQIFSQLRLPMNSYCLARLKIRFNFFSLKKCWSLLVENRFLVSYKPLAYIKRHPSDMKKKQKTFVNLISNTWINWRMTLQDLKLCMTTFSVECRIRRNINTPYSTLKVSSKTDIIVFPPCYR